jgi:hypothetical protein
MKQDKYHPIGCTLRELLLCCDPVEVAVKASLRDLDTRIDTIDDKKVSSIEFFLKQLAGYDSAITEILGYDAAPQRPLGWALDLVKADKISDVDWVNVNLYNWDYTKPPKNLPMDKLEDKHWLTFSASFAEWSEHADREIMITDAAERHFHSLSDIAAEIMWEATFSGFTGDTVKKQGDQILNECESMMNEYRKSVKAK